jgi:SAM-dependent methyltransferase
MIDRACERTVREGVQNKVDFRVADAQELPFEDGVFDAVICESVNAFVEDKPRAMAEYVRVLKPGGYVGINEVTWLEPPPPALKSYLYRIMDARFLTSVEWKGLLEEAGLKDIQALVYKTNAVSQWTQEVKQFEPMDFLKAWGRFAYMFVRGPAARKFTRQALSFPGASSTSSLLRLRPLHRQEIVEKQASPGSVPPGRIIVFIVFAGGSKQSPCILS